MAVKNRNLHESYSFTAMQLTFVQLRAFSWVTSHGALGAAAEPRWKWYHRARGKKLHRTKELKTWYKAERRKDCKTNDSTEILQFNSVKLMQFEQNLDAFDIAIGCDMQIGLVDFKKELSEFTSPHMQILSHSLCMFRDSKGSTGSERFGMFRLLWNLPERKVPARGLSTSLGAATWQWMAFMVIGPEDFLLPSFSFNKHTHAIAHTHTDIHPRKHAHRPSIFPPLS